MGHYNKKNTGSLVYQVQTTLNAMLAIGESKHQAKISGTSYAHIYSWNTYRTYLKHACPISQLSGKEIYFCRCDGKGVKFDKSAMHIASEALGHSRISVIAGHYLYHAI